MVGVVGSGSRARRRGRGYSSTASPAPRPRPTPWPITGDRPLDVVLNLDVPEDVVIERITKRRVCRSCGHIYSVDESAERGVCDK
jgi:hypothetical protein